MENITYFGDWSQLPIVALNHVFSYLPWPDTINASSTCKQWRCGLYHPHLWKSLSFSLVDFDTNKEKKAKYFIESFGKIVQFVDLSFNSLDESSSSTADNLLCTLRENTQLKKLKLIPSHCVLYSSSNGSNSTPLDATRMVYHIVTILKNTDRFEELSIGCLHDVAIYSNEFLKLISDHHSKSIRVLGLASLKTDPQEYCFNSLDYCYFEQFSYLQIISLNYDYLNDNFLQVIRNCSVLKRVVVHIHSNIDSHPGTSEQAWIQLTKHCPNVELRLNLIHAYDAVLNLHKLILKRNMPLSHLRVFFCEILNFDALNCLHMYHNTLRSLWWVDSPMYSDHDALLNTNENLNVTCMNPFIFVAWRCTVLEELVLLGYKYFADDLRAISRLRGEALKRIQVLRSEMTPWSETSNRKCTTLAIEKELTCQMGRPWKPLKRCDVHPVIFSPDKYDSDEYLVPILCQDVE